MVRLRFHLAARYEREADGRVNSFLDRNELKPTSGSMPKADLVQNKGTSCFYQKVPSYFVKSRFYL